MHPIINLTVISRTDGLGLVMCADVDAMQQSADILHAENQISSPLQ